MKLSERQPQIQVLLLILILFTALLLRVIYLGHSPSGLNVDECANAWNSYCLLKTGMDQHGIRWPILDSAGFGQGMTTLYLYLLIPFEALFGLTVTAIRLPAALAGVLTVYLVYWIGKRLFNPWIGLLSAFFLAVDPWHLQQSRWGHMASILPLVVIAPLAAMIWANLPLDDQEDRRPSVYRAAFAGALFGLCCYGYYAARLWLPLFISVIVVINWRAWWRILKTRAGAAAIGTLILFATVTFGPLVKETLMNPNKENRAQVTWVWAPADSPIQRVQKVLARYPSHFGTGFLFSHGDPDANCSPPDGYGLFHWHMLPLMLLGLWAIIPKLKTSRSARVLMAWVLLYPAADLLSEHPGPHALRSLPGVCALSMLAAVGGIYALAWIWNRQRKAAVVFALIAMAAIAVENVRFIGYFYGDFDLDEAKYLVGRSDMLQACDWLKPRLNQVDAVFITTYLGPHPYLYTLVGLQYDPNQWFHEAREMKAGPLPDGTYNHEQVCLSYGKLHFMFGDSSRPAMNDLLKNSRSDRAVFIILPGQISFGRQIEPAYRILDPRGQPLLLIYDVTI